MRAGACPCERCGRPSRPSTPGRVGNSDLDGGRPGQRVDRDDAMRAQLVDRYLTARRFLPRLIDTVTYEATPGGAEILAAVEGLGGLWGRKKVSAADVARPRGRAGRAPRSLYSRRCRPLRAALCDLR